MNNLDPERALLGAVLAHPKTIRDADDIPGDDFADPRLGELWDLMLWLDNNRMTPEPVTVLQHVSRTTMPGIDGSLIADLLTNAPVGVLARSYAHMVTENAVRRRLAIAGRRIVQLSEEEGANSQDITEEARQQIDAASRATAHVTLLGDEIDETLTTLEEDAPSAVATPWPDLDYLIEGWRPGGLYVIGARPGVGKSIAALQIAVHLSEKGLVGFHSLEMPRSEVHTRVIAQVTGIPQTRMSRRQLSDIDWQKIARARGALGSMKLAIDDRSAIRVVDIRSHARTLVRRGALAGIVVDYLQLMSAGRGDRRPRHEQVADWSRSLKVLAKELGVPVFALSQLNRQVEGRTDKRPTMSDLRESGGLEQDADVILLLHVEEDDPATMHMLVAKNRQGMTGVLKLERRGELARLDNYQWRPSQAAGAS